MESLNSHKPLQCFNGFELGYEMIKNDQSILFKLDIKNNIKFMEAEWRIYASVN